MDVTNHVLMECGQPLHAFDRDRLRGNCIRVATARPDMQFTTLDGQDRSLTENDLLIWDQERPVALAGVMGGGNSEITADSSTVLLESAVFNPVSVRKTARRLGLSSEASYRFERGVDQMGNTYAMNQATTLIAELSGDDARIRNDRHDIQQRACFDETSGNRCERDFDLGFSAATF